MAEPATPPVAPAVAPNAVGIDLDQVTADTVAELGAQIGQLTLELNRMRAAARALQQQVRGLQEELVAATGGTKTPGGEQAADAG